MYHRIQQLRNMLTKKQATACFLTNQKNIYYLTGFIGISPYEREASLLVTQDHTYLFVPHMYRDRARNKVFDDITIVTDLPKGILYSWIAYVANGMVYIEAEDLTLAEYSELKKKTSLNLFPARGMVEALRLIKSKDEIARLRHAAYITDQTWEAVQTFVQTHIDTGIREHDIIEEIQRVSTSLGSQGIGFDPIVAVGPGSAEPHYISENRKITRGQALLVDMGFVIDGYTSDFTRTMYLGKPTKEFEHIYMLVKDAQQACLDACKPAVSTTTLYNISNTHFTQHGVADLYLHSLGHGVGLDIHEAPRLSKSHNTMLQPGMVITIEPGLYLSEQFGVRIEDLVLITENGYELLSTSSKELVSLV